MKATDIMKRFPIFLLLAATVAWSQQTPAPVQDQAISITGATLHLGNGQVIENGTLVFENGSIAAIGREVTPTGRIIDASGKHVYPGIIAPVRSLGLVEIDAVRPSVDEDEIGSMIPHVRSLIAYNAESKVVESMRPNGVLLGHTVPDGGRISGTSSIVQFDAWNWEDAAIKEDDGVHLHWPASMRNGRTSQGEAPGLQPSKEYEGQKREVQDFVSAAKAYGAGGTSAVNPPYAAMQGVFSGSQRLYVYADREKEIVDALATLKDMGVPKLVLVGGAEAYKVTDLLKQMAVPVLVHCPHKLPDQPDDAYDLPYRLPAMLSEAGLLVGLQNRDMMLHQVRNLPFYAGHAAGYGMDPEAALQLITGNTAEILGISDRYGTLEAGKSATLFISEGDALDMRSNQLTHAFIDGREISLETHQTELWKRYSGKFESE